MTRKALDRQLDEIIATFCSRRGISPLIGVKGGKAEVAHSFLSMALTELTETLLTAAGAPAPAAAEPTPAADAA